MNRLIVVAPVAACFLILAGTNDHTAANEADRTRLEEPIRSIMVARFYQDKREYLGSINRLKFVLQKFPTSQFFEEALARLADAYIALGINAEAATATAVLIRKSPDSDWTSKTQEKLKATGIEPQESTESWISKALK